MIRHTKRERILPKVDNDGTEHWVEYIKVEDKDRAAEKLYQLEDIEERLGIDLATLFKGLTDGIFYKIKATNKTYYERQPKLEIAPIFNLTFEIRVSNNTVLDVVDYGKTWALTAEELE